MCGIAGLLNLDGRPADGGVVGAMTRALAHRGPDGEGVHVEGALGLGHRRLAILDLSPAGRQPMSFADGRYWITYNGEVYNFIELRRELEGCGYSFRTQADTEVILAAYDRWGPDCQLKFNGMWALAIWDARERTLFLSRDRFGIKPLYYVPEPRRFAFASEMKAFLRLEGFEPRENEAGLRRTLTDAFALESTEETLLEGVKRLRGGHCMTVRHDGRVKVWRWWNTLDHMTAPPRTLGEQAERFRELFFDSCRLRLRSDVPVATCLSGGVDSSAVLCTLAEINKASGGDPAADRRARNWQRAFVATFPGAPLDERRYAEIAVRHAGAEPHYRAMSADAALGELDRLLYDFEDIYVTLPAPIWAIYRELRRDGVVVSLDGHGADEMLGGYNQYAETALRETRGLVRSPSRTLDLVNTLHHLYAPGGPVPAPSRVRLVMDKAATDPVLTLPARAARSLRYRMFVKPWRKNGANGHAAAGAAEAAAGGGLDPAEERAIDALGPLNALLYRDFHRTVLPTILRNFDRCSMSHGIEVRMPFMDWRLVCFNFSLPEESKIGGGFTKRVLREAMRGVMPEALRTRKGKIGFNSPLPDWFAGPLRDWLWEQVNSADFLQSELWDGPAIRDKVARKMRGEAWEWVEAALLWVPVHAHLWRKTFCAGKVRREG
jgi:asparagine synthase (glutamine-hydrolysing)